MNDGQGGGGNFKSWNVPPGQLKQEIDDQFEGAAPGDYIALIVRVENPISGYQVVKQPA
jgi:hypothetical protein